MVNYLIIEIKTLRGRLKRKVGQVPRGQGIIESKESRQLNIRVQQDMLISGTNFLVHVGDSIVNDCHGEGGQPADAQAVQHG